MEGKLSTFSMPNSRRVRFRFSLATVKKEPRRRHQMAQSADQAAVTRVITAQQRKLLVDKVEKKD
jgi:hypothetical protein